MKPDYDLDGDIDTLKLAVDMCAEAERAETWKQIASALAKALHTSGWTPHSGGTEALAAFKHLRRQEYMDSLKPQP